LNEILKKARKNCGFSQEQVASAAGISKGYYSLIEGGKRRVSYELAFEIAKALGTTPDSIFLEFQSTLSK
jgi:putative transcriptional regulator